MRSVYLFKIDGTNLYKIGFTRKNPQLRLEALQTGNPFRLEYIAHYESERATKIEAALHRRFSFYKNTEESNLKGEWFQLPPEEVLRFREYCHQIDQVFEFLEKHSTLN